MPVVIEQPGPVAPGLSYAGGVADMYGKTHDDFLRMAAQTNQIISGQVQFQQQQQLQAQHAQQQAALQQQHAALQQQSQAQDLSQAEQIRLQRLQQGLTGVENDPTLSDEEKQQYRTQLMTGIDPLQKRQEAARVQAMEQANEQHKQEMATQADLTADFNNRLRAGIKPGDIVYEYNGHGGVRPHEVGAKQLEAEYKQRIAEIQAEVKNQMALSNQAHKEAALHQKGEHDKEVQELKKQIEQHKVEKSEGASYDADWNHLLGANKAKTPPGKPVPAPTHEEVQEYRAKKKQALENERKGLIPKPVPGFFEIGPAARAEAATAQRQAIGSRVSSTLSPPAPSQPQQPPQAQRPPTMNEAAAELPGGS